MPVIPALVEDRQELVEVMLRGRGLLRTSDMPWARALHISLRNAHQEQNRFPTRRLP